MPESTYKLLSDGAYESPDDPLEFHRLAEGLVDMLRSDRSSTPLTLGVQAPWGMGKSSLMHQMMIKLDEEAQTFKTVWFNAWVFEGQDVLEGMIKTVLEQLDPSALRRALRNKRFTTTLRALASIASSWLGISEMVNRVWEAVKIDPRARSQLREMLVNAMSEWVDQVPKGSSQRRIVVFIDDLDRCSPENVFAVFEAIKLYLDAPGFVFVLGIDSEIISEAILEQKKYSKKVTSEQYVEKIVQIAYNIPAASPSQLQALFDDYATESGTSDLFDDDSRQLVIDRSNNNPRRIKRFLSVFILEHQLNPDSRSLEAELLIKIIMLGMYYRAFCLLFDVEVEPDAITEFLEYEEARRALSGFSELSQDLIQPHQHVIERYGLRDPTSYGDGEFIRALDSMVPEDFHGLVRQPQFIKLVKSIDPTDRPAVAAHIKRVGESFAAEAGPARKTKASEIRLGGMNILWLDDNPRNNQGYVRDFISAGAVVLEATSKDEAISKLSGASRRYDLLISDVARGTDRNAGFEELPEIRSKGAYEGPVIFFVSSVSERAREASSKLDASITNDPAELYEMVGAISDITSMTSAGAKTLKSPLHDKIFSLNRAEQRAAGLLEGLTRDDAVERLVNEGYGRAMAESAVASAAARFG